MGTERHRTRRARRETLTEDATKKGKHTMATTRLTRQGHRSPSHNSELRSVTFKRLRSPPKLHMQSAGAL
ncbi:hypothetical protein AHAS_Ahas13G0093400 [Arachis hypogaea]